MRPLVLLLAGVSALPGASFYLTVAGLGGEAEFEQRFSTAAKDLDKIYRQGAEVHAVTLQGAEATKAKIRAALSDFAKEAKADDSVVVTMIGHGSFDGADYKFAVPGPDVSASELAAMLDGIPSKRQVVVNTTSASGASLAALEKAGRVVITATRTGTEKNATIFARYWVEALRDAGADGDKNESISALEAFRYADGRTTRFYESQKRLATEHAVLEDSGKGEAVRAPSPENGQGLLAAQIAIVRLGSLQASVKTPEKQKLLTKKEQLERDIDSLKYQKAAMPTEEYRKKLTALLLELAQTQEELEK
jgi:hypothetical protein